MSLGAPGSNTRLRATVCTVTRSAAQSLRGSGNHPGRPNAPQQHRRYSRERALKAALRASLATPLSGWTRPMASRTSPAAG